MSNYQTYKNALQGQTLPLAYIDKELLSANIKALLQRAGTKKVRIASKSIRSVEAMRFILAQSEQIQGIMCYSAEEAAWLSSLGFDDLLIAYPTTQKQALWAVAEQLRQGKKIYPMCNQSQHLQVLQQVAEQAGVKIPFCVDIDLSMPFMGLHFGVKRSDLTDENKLSAFIKSLPQYPNLQLVGLMGYEAQIAGVGDAMQGRWLLNQIIRYLKGKSIPLLRKKRAQAVAMIEKAGYKLQFVNAGGTGSLESSREEAAATELTIGSGFYQPSLFDHYKDFKHQPAAGFGLEICRIPQQGVYTCLGGGYIASGAVGKEKLPSPYLPQGCQLDPNEGAGEVQTPVIYQGEQLLGVGDPIFFRHAKAGELCERFNSLHILENGQLVAQWPTYRGEGKCFM